MSRKTPPVRYIKPTSIKIGDFIRAESKIEDATVTKVGRVARRTIYNACTEYETAQGIVLVTHWREHDQYEKITLLERPVNVVELETSNTLF